ncbi:MAG: dehydrogenase [Elusimicrobia bacterium GWC2_51_8]|nr:MAG: dehydrogenase [Elusimicrobia bacterium GWA2_51_34]OGR59514.1 MAG: dehydrogenase [Elusimicrobia bacterium GWC2_51_8]OGR86599.1 MAG: dehydrogenase [Elusimicrobia bacterium GWF2_52_66]HAF95648.1 dehydrogenase [Elusimicrobiota bacterium]
MELIISGLLVPVEIDGPEEYLKAAARKLQLPVTAVKAVRILSKSLAAGDKRQFYYEISLVVSVPSDYGNKDKFPLHAAKPAVLRKPAPAGRRPVIIGFGPAGMFAALELIGYGLKPLIFERGKKLEERRLDVQKFIGERTLTPGSNIQFGEGGAGAYSDGKLFSRPNNSVYASKVLDTFIEFGAPEETGYVSKPHLGTDVLHKITANIRNYILQAGGEINYGSKMTDIIISGGKASAVVINGSAQYLCSDIYLAIGNSARDTFELLHKKGVSLEPKPISVGVRVEHPAKTINLIRYGDKYSDFPGIGAATYSFNCTNRETGRGAYTFCMCPGGEVINASSEEGLLALNGMSYSARDSAFSNSAIAVTCGTADYSSTHPLAGIEFQRDIERKAFRAGGGNWKTPAQNLRDFLSGTLSTALNRNSCKMGTQSADMNLIFPAFISEMLRSAFSQWEKECPLFVADDAILMGPETRTSSPVRITRGKNFESVNIRNLYPIGEGSGYSGGITSSAADAIKAVEAALKEPPAA